MNGAYINSNLLFAAPFLHTHTLTQCRVTFLTREQTQPIRRQILHHVQQSVILHAFVSFHVNIFQNFWLLWCCCTLAAHVE